MPRARLLACCLAALAGCSGTPTRPPLPDPPKSRPTIPVFEEVEPRREAVEQAVLRHVPIGTPVEHAQALLEGQGFTCRPHSRWAGLVGQPEIPPEVHVPPDAYRRLFPDHRGTQQYFQARRRDRREWHLWTYPVLVVLVPDGAGLVRDVVVGLGTVRHRNADFFEKRPDLREPVGVPVEEARARMAAAGFRCTSVGPAGGGEGDRPHLLCEAFDEGLLGGHVVRVHLYPDEAGVVREARVLDEAGWFDQERCMLPRDDESAGWAACKGALFPVRLGCRYTLIALALSVGLLASGPAGAHGR